MPCRELRQGFLARIQARTVMGRDGSHEEETSQPLICEAEIEEAVQGATEPEHPQHTFTGRVQMTGGSQAADYQHLAAEIEDPSELRSAQVSSEDVGAFQMQAEHVDLAVAAEPLLQASAPVPAPFAAMPRARGARTRRQRAAAPAPRTAPTPQPTLQILPARYRQAFLRIQSIREHFVMGLLRAHRPEEVEGLSTPRGRRLLGQLRRQLVTGICFAGIGALFGTWLLFRGASALTASTGPECQCPMRDWLQGYMWLQLTGPISVPIAAIVRRASPHVGRMLLQFIWPSAMVALIVWCLVALWYIQPPPKCLALRGFLVEALALQSTTVLLLAISFAYLLATHPVIARLNELIARGGVLSEASGLVAEVDPDDAPAKEECVICLGCMEDEEPEDIEAEPLGSELVSRELGVLELEHLGSLGSEEDIEAPEHDSDCGGLPGSTPKLRPPWRSLRCGHRFHEQCLFTWLKKVKRCPICRSHMREVPAWRRTQLADNTTAAASRSGPTSTSADSSGPTDSSETASATSGALNVSGEASASAQRGRARTI